MELVGLRQATGILRNGTRQSEKLLEINGVHTLLVVRQLEVPDAGAFFPVARRTSGIVRSCTLPLIMSVASSGLPIHVQSQLDTFAQLIHVDDHLETPRPYRHNPAPQSADHRVSGSSRSQSTGNLTSRAGRPLDR